MATATSKLDCVKCGKERATLKCEGCSQDFCYYHLIRHRQELSKQTDEIEVNRDQFRQNNLLMKQINKWEENSIKTIQQTTKECRHIVIQHTVKLLYVGTSITGAPRLYGHTAERPIDFCWK
jgi:methionyl-tRNA synthetase